MFQGTGTALVTPFTTSGDIDWDAYAKLVEAQIEGGINALVVCGTTGEPSTMTLAEQEESVLFVLNKAAGRVPVIAGVGGNNTAEVVETTRRYSELDLAGLLAVTPYYNKTTQTGLHAHYTAVADASALPIMLYNVPGRTGLNLEPETVRDLADHPRITALKEASSSLAQITRVFRLAGDKLRIFSGNDDQVYALLSFGGSGVVSVTSNLAPALMERITQRYFEGDRDGSLAAQTDLLPLICELFAHVSPIPVKAAMAEVGMLENSLRLPLFPLSSEETEPLREEMAAVGLL